MSGFRPWILICAAAAAPLFWIGQLSLSYAVTAQACHPGDAPGPLVAVAMLRLMLWSFDGVALLAALAGGAVCAIAWRRTGQDGAPPVPQGRDRFLALWGVWSSLWFLCAILFNVLAGLTVTPCET